MNWQDIIHNSELVYASTPDDKMFRTWSLKKTTCNVSFYETYPVEDIDRIICGILDSNNGCLEEDKIATILGFNVIDNFDVMPKRYADKAEIDIFRAITKPVFDWGLVAKEKESDIYTLTELGYRALETGRKYRFYSGKKILFENFGIKSQDNSDSLFFPYYSELGEYSEITGKTLIEYERIIFTDVFDIEESDLIKRHKLQSKEIYHIYLSETTHYFDIKSCDVDIRLYKQNKKYYPVIFYNSQISIEATELLYKPENACLKEKKIEWGLYLKLIKDPDTVLDYETIIPFEDLLELDSLVKDTRLVWKDEQLFTFIAERANANQWHTISNQCPIEVIKKHIEKYAEKWDWTSLSLRIDDNFLIENATKYPWNFEAISAKEDISIDVLKILLLNPELKKQEWDWDNIMPHLDFDFIKTNIDKIDFELSELTKADTNAIRALIAQYPEKRWNWSYISEEYELTFILENIYDFRKYLQFKKVINRAFTDEKYVIPFCCSVYFQQSLLDTKETILKDYSPNQEKYIWTDNLIDLLESFGYLIWESGNYVCGFECNPNIEWSYNFFKKYHSKIVTEKGYSFVSQKIRDTNIVLNYLNFNWDWNAISTNADLICNKDFVLTIADKLNFALLVKNIDSEFLEELFEKSNILTFLENNPESWLPVTENATIEFARKHIDYNWDWAVLTKRFCSSIKIEALGNPKWIDKWDWKYLTRNLDLSKIYDNLDSYINYWDWEYLTEKLDKSFILHNLQKYNNYWDWSLLLCEQLEKQDLLFANNLSEVTTCVSVLHDDLQENLWKVITRKFDYVELEQLIKQTISTDCVNFFKWDYAFFYDLPAFNLRNYLQNYIDCINWEKLSCSKKLNNELFFDKKLFVFKIWINDVFRILGNTDYFWDFKMLSKINNINWCDNVLEQFITLWDWEYLSLHSSCFKQDDNQLSRMYKFRNYIDFSKFSERNDYSISEELIQKFIKFKWNWQVLSKNPTINYSAKFLCENKENDWDWVMLSDREIKDFNNETLLQLIDKSWDWSLISERKDITFSEDIISQLKDKPLNWEVVSQNESFVPTVTTLSLLKGKVLDWSAISRNENISAEILWDYRGKLNWKYLTGNKQFDISDTELLHKYLEFVDWKFVSQSEKFQVAIDNLKQFKEKLHWVTINSRKDFSISEELLEPFADVLNWTNVSKSMEISFTEDLIEKYRKYWDWAELRKNAQIIDRLDATLIKYQEEFNCADFLERFQYRKPYIYHFTHLFNAVDIIKRRKILSRNKAKELGLLKYDAAGTVVERSSKAHPFARFYYRPQTPTQFYNECLGWDDSLITSYGKSYFTKAQNLGLPKCPIPVFLKFDLKETLIKMPEKCFYSTGNMQTDRANVIKITDNPALLQMNYLFDNISDAFYMAGGPNNYDRHRHINIMERIKEYSQQEFLIEEEFDFSQLDNLEIICYDEEQARILKTQLMNDPICEKIHSNGWDIFHRNNRKLNISDSETEVFISSEYKDKAYLSIKGEGLQSIQILNPENIQKETATEILVYPEIRFTKTEQLIEVHFVDLAIGERDWLVYSNKPLRNQKIKTKFMISDDTINDFLNIDNHLKLKLSKDLFYPNMVNSCHGISHTTRVLFATWLILQYSQDITDDIREAVYYASIIHDLGKTFDKEGPIHGENSAKLYHTKIQQYISDENLQNKVLEAVKYHSINDDDCPKEVQNNIIWKILKDADALDRGRFSKRKCDKSFLRLDVFKTDTGNQIVDFMEKLALQTQNLKWDNPYKELVEIIKQIS